MSIQFNISREKISKLTQFDLSRLYLYEKRDLSKVCFYAGILIAYFGSLHPWFLWPLKELYIIPASGLVFLAYLISNSMQKTSFSRTDYLKPLLIYIILSFYVIIVGNQNINAYIINIFSIVFFFTVFKIDIDELRPLGTFISKIMALLLIPSIGFFILYILGFGLPSSNAVFGDNDYSFSNYYFFMIDDRSLTILIPRFQSVFLEPGHLGSATSLLLMTQMGHWKRWWNIVLLIATIISFSLAAYALLIGLVFLSMWVRRKNIIGKILLSVSIIAGVAITATYYNNGDNMVNNLILARMEIDEKTGDIVGNNRVDENFEKEFDKFVTSSDIFTGRDMSKIPKGSGNSGYRVFIYQNGLIGLILVVLLYYFSFKGYRDYRYLISAIIIAITIFWIRGYPLWYSNFIPLFLTAYLSYKKPANKSVLA